LSVAILEDVDAKGESDGEINTQYGSEDPTFGDSIIPETKQEPLQEL
jgi:hypothetical protein